ncbi:MAG TPA: PA0069 family radical SAM protein [Hypericibacter adhaerens]|uniref:PA0069 family radical SAM protein n=1 Tax=Hypericibacter adhaerens TaxID=2602016 RepID=UPI002CB9F394|nr:PA0069 family radical SAM protein [Hypericibacter adhaerens]HWA42644.1 PA0069 family radical SAM protein [Hypericibacter adhaerens]
MRTEREAPDGPDPTVLAPQARKGRGAVSNRPGRYEPGERPLEDDGWDSVQKDEAEAPPLRTTVQPDKSKTVIAWNESPDVGFDRSINPYRGCEHGCIYCFARPTHAYLGLSPGLDFETRLFAKHDAAAILARELAKPGYKPAPIGIGTNTDPYQPIERELRITRQVLEVLDRFNHPVTIVTKSALILRDLDILSRMAQRELVQATVSVTTLDPDLARKLEPRAPTPPRRLATIEALAAAGIPTGVLAAPMIPALNDQEMEAILAAAAARGVVRAGYVLLRLPLEIADLFREWLQAHVPDRAEHVLSLMRDTRDGKLYRSGFGTRMRGTGPYAELLRQRYRIAMRKLGLAKRGGGAQGLRNDLFAVPQAERAQFELF